MKISIVMCTYNGAKYIKEQLDSIVSQTITPYEVLIQDDGSTDATMAITKEYATRYPYIRLMSNDGIHGVNGNFFSAMRKAKGDYIAISDQDDIWMHDKLEILSAAIGDKMMCVGRNVHFRMENGKEVIIPDDNRRPNCNIIRLLYASMPGHCMLFRRELLDHLPAHLEESPIFTRTYYDVLLGQTAASLDSILLVDRRVVKQRRYAEAASYQDADAKRTRSANNGLSMVWYGICHYRKIKPLMAKHFSIRGSFLKSIKSDKPIYHDAIRLVDYESGTGIMSLLGLMRMYMKYRHTIFYTYEKDPIAIIRALLHPFMQIYNYRFLIGKSI